MKLRFYLLYILLSLTLQSCVLNNPYRDVESNQNYVYNTFINPPKHLDPVISYSAGEYVWLQQIYEQPLQYHYLKRPEILIPMTATEVPQPVYYDKNGQKLTEDPSSEQVARAVYTVRIKPGILYQNHPCFAKTESGQHAYLNLTDADMVGIADLSDFPLKGTREVNAADYIYQIKRMAHPKLPCPIFSTMAKYIIGLDVLEQQLAGELKRIRAERKQARGVLYNQEMDEREKPIYLDLDQFDTEGLRVLDKYTYQIILKQKYPQLVYWLAMPFFAPIPKEADLFFTQASLVKLNLSLDNRPVGTGPYRMEKLLPNKEIVLVKNEHFRGEPYPDSGEPQDRGNGLLKDAGQTMPFVEKAIYKLEKEAIPRWNKFLQGYYEGSTIVDSVFDQIVQTDFDGGLNLSDKMHERDIRLDQAVRSTTRYFAFNMLDEIVGGYTPQKQKLRQAISIALDIEEWIQIFFNGRGLPAQDLIPPGIFGHQSGPDGINPYIYDWDEAKGEPKRKSLEIARQLLAEAGYPGGKDRDGNPLVIHFDSAWRGAVAKSRFDWMRKQFAKLNIDLQIRQTDSNRFREKINTGNYQFLYYGWNADYPDPENFHFLLYGPNSRAKYRGENASNYNNPEFDRLFKQVEVMQNGPKRMALLKQISELIRKDAPWVWGYHPILYGLNHQWYTNTKPMIMGRNALKYQRLNPELRAQKRAEWNRPIWWPVALGAVLLMSGAVPAVITVRNRDRKVDA